MPPGSPSLGELLLQGKSNLQAPWLGLSGFAVIAVTLSLRLPIRFQVGRETTATG